MRRGGNRSAGASSYRNAGYIMDFDMLGLEPRLLKALDSMGLTAPTPIQQRAIPEALQGRDVMGLAQTGTGKTAAFGLPLVHTLLTEACGKPAPKTARALVLAPTRELVSQIVATLETLSNSSPLGVARVVGGVGIGPQIKRLARGVDILVATPGRLIDLLDRQAVRLDETQFLVLDEADQMLDLGFIHALRRIARLLPQKRQTLLFSATMPKQMAEIAETYLNRPIRIEVAPPGKPADKVTQEVHFLSKSEKTTKLIALLDAHRDELAIVFARTKHGSDRLARQLDRAGYATAAVHGNRSQGQRERALKAFRAGDLRVLVATDVAARGLDIPAVRHVYNFDLPNVAENYVHRIGRTARAGASGAAVAFCAPDETGALRDIEALLGRPLPIASGDPHDGGVATANRPGGKPGGRRRSGKPGASSGSEKTGGPARPRRRRRRRRDGKGLAKGQAA